MLVLGSWTSGFTRIQRLGFKVEGLWSGGLGLRANDLECRILGLENFQAYGHVPPQSFAECTPNTTV